MKEQPKPETFPIGLVVGGQPNGSSAVITVAYELSDGTIHNTDYVFEKSYEPDDGVLRFVDNSAPETITLIRGTSEWREDRIIHINLHRGHWV